MENTTTTTTEKVIRTPADLMARTIILRPKEGKHQAVLHSVQFSTFGTPAKNCCDWKFLIVDENSKEFNIRFFETGNWKSWSISVAQLAEQLGKEGLSAGDLLNSLIDTQQVFDIWLARPTVSTQAGKTREVTNATFIEPKFVPTGISEVAIATAEDLEGIE